MSLCEGQCVAISKNRKLPYPVKNSPARDKETIVSQYVLLYLFKAQSREKQFESFTDCFWWVAKSDKTVV